jgi:hypothetical protein
MKTEVLWTLPVPSTGLVAGPVLKPLIQKSCAIEFQYELDDDNVVVECELVFSEILSFRVTYSLRAPALDAYDRLVDCGQTAWLAEWRDCVGPQVKHLMVTFDDGPCYEFLCARWACLTRPGGDPTQKEPRK